jgi:hypothetical protein
MTNDDGHKPEGEIAADAGCGSASRRKGDIQSLAHAHACCLEPASRQIKP